MSYVDIVFDGQPGPEGPVFVETEDAYGNSISIGDWVKRPDDYWVLRVEHLADTDQRPSDTECRHTGADELGRRKGDCPRCTVELGWGNFGDKQTSDGHHTFEELYYYRMLYNAQAAQAWLATGIKVEKSWNHHDGEPCFGGGMFVVQAELPTGQVSNHYKPQFWDLFNVPAVELPEVYDGHTPAEAAERMRDYLVSQQTG